MATKDYNALAAEMMGWRWDEQAEQPELRTRTAT
jgi:hypothetical protein